MSKIIKILAREILDSRGNPTVQVELETEFGRGLAKVPSGASTGTREACELRDGNVETPQGRSYAKNWFGGKGVMTAVDNVNQIIAPKLIGMEVSHQKLLDETMIKLDGTKNKTNLGANAILGVSMAALKAAADEQETPLYRYIGGVGARTLPLPMLNVINGGEHASNTLDFQEFMIVPVGAKTFYEAMQMANKIFHNLAKILKANGYETQVGDEGGFAPDFKSTEEALETLVKAIEAAGYKAGREGENTIGIAMDAAASEIYDAKTKTYNFKKLEAAIKAQKPGFEKLQTTKTNFTTDELIEYWVNLTSKYPIISLEDGFDESDWSGFEKLTAKIGHQVQIVGDDLTVTNSEILAKAIKERAINSILIKLNQIGTVSETIETIQLAHKAGYTAVVSHRSGETDDTTIADLAVGLGTGQIKTGSMSRIDRIAKYNRLLNIEQNLGVEAIFAQNPILENLAIHKK